MIVSSHSALCCAALCADASGEASLPSLCRLGLQPHVKDADGLPWCCAAGKGCDVMCRQLSVQQLRRQSVQQQRQHTWHGSI